MYVYLYTRQQQQRAMYKNNNSIITLIEPKYRQQNLNNKQTTKTTRYKTIK